MAEQKTSNWTHKDFCNWSIEQVFNGLLTGGIKGMRNAIVYDVIQECCRLMNQGGFVEEHRND